MSVVKWGVLPNVLIVYPQNVLDLALQHLLWKWMSIWYTDLWSFQSNKLHRNKYYIYICTFIWCETSHFTVPLWRLTDPNMIKIRHSSPVIHNYTVFKYKEALCEWFLYKECKVQTNLMKAFPSRSTAIITAMLKAWTTLRSVLGFVSALGKKIRMFLQLLTSWLWFAAGTCMISSKSLSDTCEMCCFMTLSH